MGDYRKAPKFLFAAWLSMAIVGGSVLIALFRPIVGFEIKESEGFNLRSDDFLRHVRIMADTPLYHDCKVEALTNGDVYYEAELEAMQQARESIAIEVYIFTPGEIADRFRDVLTERARAGVQVRLILDAVGSMDVPFGYFDRLEEAGGQVAYYHPAKWYLWDRLNNRTHREIYLVDNVTAFLGGAGVADHWWKAQDGLPAWRDTMFRVQGEVLDSVASTFLENWVEATGQILPVAPADPAADGSSKDPCFVVGSTPSAGGSSRARILYQFFVESAEKSIFINNPYFIPDEDLRQALARAAGRGVEVQIILPGDTIDWEMTRSASRRGLGELLQAGVEIHEYQPTMNHRKIFVIDDLWSVVGTTNFDNRSFGLNDEINLIVRDEELAGRLRVDFKSDLEESDPLTYEEWLNRPWLERAQEFLSGLLARQQ